ncbi:MAG: hypothetical protein RBS34_00400 [Desulfofustis sp.]|jgi:hypothetical protein|nr:hypothetical protein [Desulfofustis sp.]
MKITDGESMDTKPATFSFSGPPMTIEVLREAMAKLASIPKNDQWLVVTPDGEIYQGTVTQVLPVLIERHPLLHKSLEFPIQFNEPA